MTYLRNLMGLRTLRTLVATLLALAAVSSGKLFAQPTPGKAADPQNVEIRTKDEVLLQATYYPGSKGKETIPIIMLHQHKGNRRDFEGLAKFFQGDFFGAAVLVPDLRGHGESTVVQGSNRPLSADKLNTKQFQAMVAFDMESCKKFLMERHHKGELNIEQLTLIGAEMGASVAMLYARNDWNWPTLTTGKQGQDVRAIAMISPQPVFKGLRMQEALAEPDNFGFRRSVQFFMAVGAEDSKSLKDVERLEKQLQRFRPNEAEKKPEEASIVLSRFPTKLQGKDILAERSFGLDTQLAQFVDFRVKQRAADVPWKERKSPLGN
jgi:pimeloyl-ACP methyl ester carboxylesterase